MFLCVCVCVEGGWRRRREPGAARHHFVKGQTPAWSQKHAMKARESKGAEAWEGNVPALPHWDPMFLVACPGIGTKTLRYSSMGGHCHWMLPDSFGKPHIYFMHRTPKELCGQNSFPVLDQTESPQTLGYYLEKEMYIC